MKIDRDLQYKILTKLENDFPSRMSVETWNSLIDEYKLEKTMANLLYLSGHKLVENDPKKVGSAFQITEKGLDFLANDGGLSAILNVVTVKLHDDTLRDLIRLKIDESDLPQKDKLGLTDRLQSLPYETIKHLYLKLVDMAVSKAPESLQLIQTFLQGL